MVNIVIEVSKYLMILLIAGAIFAYVKLHDKFDGKHHDPRGFARSKSGIYGTASWMDEKEMKEVLNFTKKRLFAKRNR